MFVGFYTIIRSLYVTSAAAKRFPSEWRRNRELRAAEKAMEEGALTYERCALDQTIREQKLVIGDVEMTNVLGFYVLRGATLSQAHYSYRALLERGKRLPAKSSTCEKAGRSLRASLNRLTPEDHANLRLEKIRRAKETGVAAIVLAPIFFAVSMRAFTTEEYTSGMVALFAAPAALVYGIRQFRPSKQL